MALDTYEGRARFLALQPLPSADFAISKGERFLFLRLFYYASAAEAASRISQYFFMGIARTLRFEVNQ